MMAMKYSCPKNQTSGPTLTRTATKWKFSQTQHLTSKLCQKKNIKKKKGYAKTRPKNMFVHLNCTGSGFLGSYRKPNQKGGILPLAILGENGEFLGSYGGARF